MNDSKPKRCKACEAGFPEDCLTGECWLYFDREPDEWDAALEESYDKRGF
jgi:hypothetical protein